MHAGCVQGVAKDKGLDLVVPAPQLCTDNGVMVAWAGAERLALGLWEHLPASALEDAWVDVRPRWPLTDQCVA
jgi:N6-L-threonylcarbamoyladenine synthase